MLLSAHRQVPVVAVAMLAVPDQRIADDRTRPLVEDAQQERSIDQRRERIVRRRHAGQRRPPVDDRSEHRLDASKDLAQEARRRVEVDDGRRSAGAAMAGAGGSVSNCRSSPATKPQRGSLSRIATAVAGSATDQIVLVKRQRVLAAAGRNRLKHVPHRAEPLRVAMVAHARIAERRDVVAILVRRAIVEERDLESSSVCARKQSSGRRA